MNRAGAQGEKGKKIGVFDENRTRAGDLEGSWVTVRPIGLDWFYSE